jgi:hypothetical protein
VKTPPDVAARLETGTIQPGEIPDRVAGYLRQTSSGGRDAGAAGPHNVLCMRYI